MAIPGEVVIQVKDVRRMFRSPIKGHGLQGALKLLWQPQYKEHEALKGVSFTLEPGSFTGLIGANGAGKTTLLKILSGLIPPSSGQVSVLGFTPFQRSIEFRRSIALVMGQKAQLWWDLPATDAFDLLRAIYDIPTRLYQERVNTLAELLDVTSHLHTQIRRLSLGERMKMELIGALIHWPRVIFLDEPTIGLDVLAAHKLREFLKAFNKKEKATIVLTSHNMDDIERLCSRVLILKTGELIYDGKPGGLTQKEERILKVRLLETPTREKLAELTHLSVGAIEIQEDRGDVEDQGIYFSIRQNEIVALLQTLLQHFHIVDMSLQEQNLENIIQRLYTGEKVLSTSRMDATS